MRFRGTVVLVGLATVGGASLSGHHAVARVYDERQTSTIAGVVERIVYQQPHPFVYVEVADRRGAHRTWAVEFDGRNLLGGPTPTTAVLHPGDRVKVCGNPGRDPGEYRLRMLSLERADGLTLKNDIGPVESCRREASSALWAWRSRR